MSDKQDTAHAPELNSDLQNPETLVHYFVMKMKDKLLVPKPDIKKAVNYLEQLDNSFL